MIKNEREYTISKSWLTKLGEALETAKGRKPKDSNDAERLEVRGAGLKSQHEELQEDLATYEALKEGHTRAFIAHSLNELPQGLIMARIAQGLTHKQLAEKLGVSEKQA
jgi:DNA-directed RNA polymerase specialized sigma subunit